MDGKIDPGTGYRLLEIGEIIPHGFERYNVSRWETWEDIVASHADHIVGSEVEEYHMAFRIPKIPKDPKTKYHRPMYPAWNDTEVHTDANGHQYLNVDVYSVLAAFDPGHEVAHAVKKLLAAGTRDKGSKIQDYREAIISIEAAIYRAEIEGGAG